jgi:hypothetical protein
VEWSAGVVEWSAGFRQRDPRRGRRHPRRRRQLRERKRPQRESERVRGRNGFAAAGGIPKHGRAIVRHTQFTRPLTRAVSALRTGDAGGKRALRGVTEMLWRIFAPNPYGKLEQGLASAFIQSAPSRSSFEGSDSTSATTFIHTAAMAASHASVPHQESQPGLLRMKRILKRNFLVGLHTPASLG